MDSIYKRQGKMYYWKRSAKFFFQRLTRKWSDDETWNLDTRLAEHILPRLKRFKQLNTCYPPDITFEEWNKHLDAMIYAFDYLSQDIADRVETVEIEEDVQKGLDLFAQFYRGLWW